MAPTRSRQLADRFLAKAPGFRLETSQGEGFFLLSNHKKGTLHTGAVGLPLDLHIVDQPGSEPFGGFKATLFIPGRIGRTFKKDAAVTVLPDGTLEVCAEKITHTELDHVLKYAKLLREAMQG